MVGSTQAYRPGVLPSRVAPAGTVDGDRSVAFATSVAPSCRLVTTSPPSWPPLLHARYGASTLSMGPLTSAPVSSPVTDLPPSRTLPLLPSCPQPHPTAPDRNRCSRRGPRSSRDRVMASPLEGRLAAVERRNGFLSYGLGVRLRLLSTSPLGNAVTFGYRSQAWDLAGCCPPLTTCARRRTFPALTGWGLALVADGLAVVSGTPR